MRVKNLPPIFIPSKGRATANGTWTALQEVGLPYTVVVEPQDFDEYKQHHAHYRHASVVSLPKNDQGVQYVRNYILYKLSPPVGWYWCIDDDVTVFYALSQQESQQDELVRVNIKQALELASPADALTVAPNACLLGLEYLQFASMALNKGRPLYRLNSYANICCCINRSRFPKALIVPDCDFTYRFPIREDYDMCLQIITNGGSVFRFRNVSFSAPGMGTKPGGMTEYYRKKQKEIIRCNRTMVRFWGDDIVVECIKGKGETEREDLRIMWFRAEKVGAGEAEPPPGGPISFEGTSSDDEAQTKKKKKKPAPKAKRAREQEEELQEVVVAVKEKGPPPPKVAPGWQGWTVVEDIQVDPKSVGLNVIPSSSHPLPYGAEVCLLHHTYGFLRASVMSCNRKSKSSPPVLLYCLLPDPFRRDVVTATLTVDAKELCRVPSTVKECERIANLVKGNTVVDVGAPLLE
eukprot:PhF_6_TR36127/c0_g1_i2/m.52438